MSWLSELVADGFHEVLMFGDASGTTATDSSGNSRPGTYVGSPTLGAASLLANDATTSVDFNGTSQYVDVTVGTWMDVTNISLVCRKRFDDAPGVIELLACRYPATTAQRVFQWNRQASGVMGLAWHDSGGTLRSVVGSTVLAANTDYTLGMSITAAGVATLYVNGVADGTFSTPGSLSMRTSSPIGMRVGAYHNAGNTLFTDGRMQGFGYGPSVSAARHLVYHQVATSLTVALGQATETDSALTLAAVKVGQIITLGLATETDSALAATVTSGQVVSLGLATETDAAQAITVSQVVSLGLATETDSALAVTTRTILTLGFATEADTALAAAVAQTVHLGLATETDSALGVTVSGGATIITLGFAAEVNSALAVAVVLGYTLTDSDNDDDGIYLGDGLAEVVWDPGVVPVPPHLSTATDQARIVAKVIDTAPSLVGGIYTPAAAREAWIPEPLDRVLINGPRGWKDFTFFRGAALIVEQVKLIDPLLYGNARITIPAVNPQFPDSLGDLVTYFQFARVKVQRVLDGEIIATRDYKGFVSRVDISGTSLGLEIGGEAAGALSQMQVMPHVYRRKQDVEHILVDLLRDARVQAHEHDGVSGVGLIHRGGSDGLSVFNETLAVWAGSTGSPITFTPNADGVYRKTVKATTGIDFTAYPSDLVGIDLSQDFMEQYTRIFARGFTANGEIVTNIKNPGMTQHTPDFNESSPSIGAVQQQLVIHNFLDYADITPDEMDDATESALLTFKAVAGLPQTTDVDEDTWHALFNLAVIGYSLDDAREYPMVQDIRTIKWFRTANGSRKKLNPAYDPNFIPNDLFIDVGGPFTRKEIVEFAKSKMAPEGGIWTGQIVLRSGVVAGEHNPGDPLDSGDVLDRRDILPNDRGWLPYFAGGITVYVAGVDHTPDQTTLLVSTVPQTTMETWQAIERRKEAKSNPGRAWSGHTRASQVRNDEAVQWDTSSGWIAHQTPLTPGWTEIMVPAGQAGIVQRIRSQLSADIAYALVLSQKPIVGLPDDPLVDPRPGGEVADEDYDVEHRPWWERPATAALLEERGMLEAWGTPKQPCGYDPGLKTDENGATGAPKTGLFVETAGFNYETEAEPVLYVNIWTPLAGGEKFLQPGRILRNQRTTDF